MQRFPIKWPNIAKAGGGFLFGWDEEPRLVLFSKISAGARHSLAIDTEGYLWSWGNNFLGRTGLGTSEGLTTTPTKINSPLKFVDISAGSSHSLAIAEDGTLWAWGWNGDYLTGLDTNLGSQLAPTQVGLDNNWKQVSAGLSHSHAIKTNGTLWAWGINNQYRTGLNTDFGETRVPTQVGVATTWIQVSAGSLHSHAIRTNGTLWAWGSNASGRTGTGPLPSPRVPTQVDSATNWKQVSASALQSHAIKTNGRLYGTGQVFINGASQIRTSFSLVNSDNDWDFVSSGAARVEGETFNIALKTDNTLWSWGMNRDGMTGLELTSGIQFVPTKVNEDGDWGSISAGKGFFSLATKLDGTMWSWGTNEDARTGLGITEGNTPTPTQVSVEDD